MKKFLALAVAVMAMSGVASAQTYSDTQWYDMYQAGIVSWNELPHTLRINVLEINAETNMGSRDFEPRLRTGAMVDYDVNYSDYAVGTGRELSTEASTSTNGVYVPANKTVVNTKGNVKTTRTDWTLDSDVVELYKMGLIEYKDLPHNLRVNTLEIDAQTKSRFKTPRAVSMPAMNTIVLKDTVDRTFEYNSQSFRDAERFESRAKTNPRRHMSDSFMRYAPQSAGMTQTGMNFMGMPGKTRVVKANYVNRKSYMVSPDQYHQQAADVLRLRMKQDTNGGVLYR